MKYIDKSRRIVQLEDDEDVWSGVYMNWLIETLAWQRKPFWKRWFTKKPQYRIQASAQRGEFMRMRGFSFIVSMGQYGGFYISPSRLCLGWIAFTVIREDIDGILMEWVTMRKEKTNS